MNSWIIIIGFLLFWDILFDAPFFLPVQCSMLACFADAFFAAFLLPQGSKIFYNKSAAEQERLKLSEVKHSRVAMLAIIGELVQMMMFHKVSKQNQQDPGRAGGVCTVNGRERADERVYLLGIRFFVLEGEGFSDGLSVFVVVG